MMHKVKRPPRLFLSLSCACMLTACSSEPSDADIRRAVERQVGAQNASMEQLLGKGITQAARTFTGEVKGARKIGCQADGDQAYVCDVELEIEHLGTLAKEPARYRFVKGSEGWMVSR